LSGRVDEFPVGDPLTPGGGPGRAELRLEEEDFEEEELEKEEEEGIEGDEGTQEGREVPGEVPSPTWELFGHLLVEDASRPGRVSVLRCVRCGAEAPLTDLKTLKKVPCKTAEAEKREAVVSLPRKCENCGREAVASLCDICAETFERYAEAARPAPLRGRGGVRPSSVPGVDGWAWVAPLTTFFPFRRLEGGGREWWCPACKKTTRRLIDAVDHFREAHPLLASRGWYEEFDTKTRRTKVRNWQGWIDEQQLQLILESEVKP
jgi:uncharacterized C2H2 Zn-finger protein